MDGAKEEAQAARATPRTRRATGTGTPTGSSRRRIPPTRPVLRLKPKAGPIVAASVAGKEAKP